MNNLIACCGVVSSCDLITKLIILTLVCWHGNCYHCSSLSLAARSLLLGKCFHSDQLVETILHIM